LQNPEQIGNPATKAEVEKIFPNYNKLIVKETEANTANQT